MAGGIVGAFLTLANVGNGDLFQDYWWIIPVIFVVFFCSNCGFMVFFGRYITL